MDEYDGSFLFSDKFNSGPFILLHPFTPTDVVVREYEYYASCKKAAFYNPNDGKVGYYCPLNSPMDL